MLLFDVCTGKNKRTLSPLGDKVHFWRRRRDSNWYILDFTICRGISPCAAKYCNSKLFWEIYFMWCQCVPTGFTVVRVRIRVKSIISRGIKSAGVIVMWPPACEDTSRRQSPAIGCFSALLAPVSAGTKRCLVHCVHPLIFWYWSAYWSKPRPCPIRRSRDFFSRANLVAVIVTWTGTIVKYLFPTQATCAAPPPLHQMVGKYMNKTNITIKKTTMKNRTEITQLLYQAASW